MQYSRFPSTTPMHYQCTAAAHTSFSSVKHHLHLKVKTWVNSETHRAFFNEAATAVALDTWDLPSSVWFLDGKVVANVWQGKHSVEHGEQSDIFSTGMCLLQLNFCWGSFTRAYFFFFLVKMRIRWFWFMQSKDSDIRWVFVPCGTGPVNGRLWKFSQAWEVHLKLL